MYYWKYWRDTRRGIFVYLGVLVWVLLFWFYGLLRENRLHHLGDDPRILWMMEATMTFVTTNFCAILMGFVTGSTNAGSDFRKGTAEFLLTRPRLRRSFIWTGWLTGLGEVLGLMVVTAALIMGATTLVAGAAWRHVESPLRFHIDQQFLNIPNMVLALIITAALIFGLTYFLGVLFKNSQRGLIASLGICAGYSALDSLLRIWTHTSLPELGAIYGRTFGGTGSSSPHLAMLGWGLVALACPFAAQLVLERAEA
jgi:ABC-type transport system involved in multi-copper enzyme maturation permease subunit